MISIFKSRVVTVAALLLVLGVPLFAQMKEYPRWFIFPGEYPGLITGLTNKGNSALEDAAITATAYRKCIVDGSLYFISKEDITFPHRATDYFYYYPEDQYLELLPGLNPVDSLVTNVIRGESIAAFSTDTKAKPVKERVRTVDIPRPGWLGDQVNVRNGYHWSVGKFPSKGNENDSWRTAEERAIFAALLTLDIEVTSTTTIDNTAHKAEEYKRVIEFKVKKILSDISVIERYPDAREKMNYVLLRLKIE